MARGHKTVHQGVLYRFVYTNINKAVLIVCHVSPRRLNEAMYEMAATFDSASE